MVVHAGHIFSRNVFFPPENKAPAADSLVVELVMSRIRVLSGKHPIYTNIDINMNTNMSYIYFLYISLYIPMKLLVNIVRTGTGGST